MSNIFSSQKLKHKKLRRITIAKTLNFLKIIIKTRLIKLVNNYEDKNIDETTV